MLINLLISLRNSRASNIFTSLAIIARVNAPIVNSFFRPIVPLMMNFIICFRYVSRFHRTHFGE